VPPEAGKDTTLRRICPWPPSVGRAEPDLRRSTMSSAWRPPECLRCSCSATSSARSARAQTRPTPPERRHGSLQGRCTVPIQSFSNACFPFALQSARACSASPLLSLSAIQSSAPRMTARSSPVSSTTPDLTTRPPSSIRRRVRLRRSTCHARTSCRARVA